MSASPAVAGSREIRKAIVTTSYYRPDHAGIAVYATDFADFLAERGIDTTVVTTFPFYPSWKKRPEDEGKLFAEEHDGRIRVLRGYSFVPQRPSTLKRIIHEASVALFAAVNFGRAGRADAVVLFSPPFVLGLVAWLYARLVGATFVINVQDLPTGAAAALGMVKQGAFLRAATAVEAFVYRRADQLTTLSDAMLEQVRRMEVDAARTLIVPNWIDTERAIPATEPNAFRRRHGIPADRFLISYAGNLGIKQGLDALVSLASKLETDERFEIVLAGEGADKQRLQALRDELGANRLRMLPFLDSGAYRELLNDSDLIFVAQRAGAGDNFFPSKLLGIMAAGRPLLVCAEPSSELWKETSAHGSAACVPYDAPQVLLDKVRELARNRALLLEIAERGKSSVRRYDRRVVLERWVESINGLR